MTKHLRHAATAVIGGAALIALGAPAITHAAAPDHDTLYVSPTGTNTNDGSSCAQATYSSIQTAVTDSIAGGRVVVCAGTYNESVTVDKPLTLVGQSAVVNAAGQPYGIGLAASYSAVSGFTVQNAHADPNGAPGDGILTAGFVGGNPVASSHDIITNNTATNNDGSGIDLLSSSSSTVSHNVASQNGIGINVSNDLGAASSHNVITGNTTNKNPGGCGIVLADHTGSGVFANLVIGNTARGNGLGTPSAPNASSGSGIIIAAGGKNGGVYNNVLRGNTLTGNGHGGVALHGHSKGPKFSGNVIIGNTIGKNNLRTDYKDRKTTGVYLGDVAKLQISVKDNLFKNNHYGVFSAGPVTVKHLKSNGFLHVTVHHKHIAKYAG